MAREKPQVCVWPILLAASVAGLAARLAVLSEWHGWPLLDVLIGDGKVYHVWAGRIAAGDWMGGDAVFYQAPLYPYFLAVVRLVAGDSLHAVRLVQAVMGGISCGMVGAAAGRFIDRTAGWTAGLMLALYPPAVFFDLSVQKSALDGFLLAILLALLASAPRWKRSRWWVAPGLVLGLLVLARENALVLAPAAACWAIAAGRSAPTAWPVRVASLLALLLGLALPLGAVAARNFAVSGEVVVTTSQLGPNLYIGNHAGADGTYVSLRPGRGDARVEADDARRLAEVAMGRSLSSREVSRYWVDRTAEQIVASPRRWLTLVGRKAALLVNRAEVADTEDIYTYADHSVLLGGVLRFWHFGVLFPLAALGMVLSAPQWRRLWVLYALAALYAVSVIAFYVVARYRYPLVPVLAIFAGAAVSALAQWVRSRQWSAAGWALAAMVPFVFAANVRLVALGTMRAVTLHNLGVALVDDGRVDQGQVHLRRAIELHPTYAKAHNSLGVMLARQDRLAEAMDYYREAVELEPGFADAHYNLGVALGRSGDSEGAATAYRAAAEADPLHADARTNLGVLLAARGDLEAAAALYLQALAIEPRHPQAANNLGTVLARQGRYNEAAAQFRSALQARPDYPDAKRNLERVQDELGRQGR
jgi:Flp pilus assembly protein TadD